MIVLLVMTDGRRDTLQQTVASAQERLSGAFSRVVVHDDSGDPDHRAWLRRAYPLFEHIGAPSRLGFGGAIANAWRHLAATQGSASFVFHLEDDFTFNEMIDVDALCGLLIRQRQLVQVALKRQAWNQVELAAGGIVEANPTEFIEHTDGIAFWTAHRLFFTTNPSVYRTSLLFSGWPDGERSEGAFTHQLLAHHPGMPFAYWGRKHEPPKVTHIGDQRAGSGY